MYFIDDDDDDRDTVDNDNSKKNKRGNINGQGDHSLIIGGEILRFLLVCPLASNVKKCIIFLRKNNFSF